MKNHYYLVSSLYDLLLDEGKLPVTMEEFLDFCEEQLSGDEAQRLKKLFIFNDIKNLCAGKGAEFQKPSYYSEDELAELRQDPGLAFPFLQRYLDSGEKIKGNPVDVVTAYFYEDLDSYAQDEVRDYFLFELNLRNISTALILRNKKQPYHDKIIPFGEAADHILGSTSLDFGLGSVYPVVGKLIELLGEKTLGTLDKDQALLNLSKEPDQAAIEKLLDETRWEWLTENWEYSVFGTMTVLSYAVKLGIVERWYRLSAENGEKFFNQLLNQIKGSIVFSDELFIGRGKK